MRLECLESRLFLTLYTTYVGTKVTVTTTGGNDTVIISLSAGNTLSVSVNGVNDYNLGNATSVAVLTGIEVQLGGGNDSVTLGATTKAITQQTTLNGSTGADTITGGAGPDLIFGGSGNDSIDGGLGADSISGGLDNDTVSYATRSTGVNVNMDLLANDGAPGEGDWVGDGTTDVESIMGGSGNDTITGNSGGNYISGGAGADNIHAGAGSDTICGGAGVDSLYGEDDADFIFARDGEIDVIDGGAGIDSADTDPGEASPIPEFGAPVVSSFASAPVTSSLSTTGSSTRKLFGTRKIKSRRVSRLLNTVVTNALPSSPLPSDPLPSNDVEGSIDAQSLPSIIAGLDGYAAGQVLVTRDNNGQVNIGGTSGNDAFEIRTSDDPAGPIRIYNNGGLTEFFLPTPQLSLHTKAGSDNLIVGAGPAMNGQVQVTPDKAQTGGGTVTLNGHAIVLSQSGQPPIAGLTIADVNQMTFTTPLAHDVLAVTLNSDGNPQLGGQSDALPLLPVAMSNVANLTLDTGANDGAGNGNDTVTFDAGPDPILPHLSLLPGSIGSDTLNNASQLVLNNNPRGPGAQPTLTINSISPSANLTFLAPATELVALNLQAGSATVADNGNSVLATHQVNIGSQSQLDLRDNSLVVDSPNSTPLVAGLIKKAYNIGAPTHWTGPGITSSIAANDPSKGIGYADSAAVLGAGGGIFHGVSVSGSGTLASFTLNGDTNLDRTVNFTDLVSLAQNYSSSGPSIGWFKGDFNYDNTVNFNDLVPLAQNYGQTLTFLGGLQGQYFEAPNNANYDRDVVSASTAVGVRIDPRIDFLDAVGGTGQEKGPFNGTFNGSNVANNRIAGTGLADDQFFTARWEGTLTVPTDGIAGTDHFTLFTRSDDGIRVSLGDTNGDTVIDHWYDNRGVPGLPGDTSQVLTLTKGKTYPIVVEFNQGGGGAGAGIYWKSDSLVPSQTIIPAFDPNNANAGGFKYHVTLPAAPSTLVVYQSGGIAETVAWNDNSNNEARFRVDYKPVGAPDTAYVIGAAYAGPNATNAVVRGLTQNTTYTFRVAALNFAGVAIDTTTLDANTGTDINLGPGVIAQYFNSPTPTNNEPYFYNRNTGAVLTPDVQRVDPNINTNWGSGSPDPLITGDNFMSRYSGKITITTGGNYTFRVNSDDASYAWVNGRLVSQYPGGHGANNGATNFPITLAPGTYPFVYEQAEGGGGAAAFFYYTGPDTANAEQIVPTGVLAAANDLPAAATGLTGTAFPTSISLSWNDVALNEYLGRVEYKLDTAANWTVAQTYDVINNPNSAPAGQSLNITGLTPGTLYDFRVVDTNLAGDAIATTTISTLSVPPGSLTLSSAVADGDHSLTSEGNLDWIHFGYPNDPTKVHDKGSVPGPHLVPFGVIGGGTALVTSYNTTGDTFTWNDAAAGAVSNIDITSPGDNIVGIPTNGNAPNEDVTKAIDNDPNTKYLNFAKLGTGFIVTPGSALPPIGGISLTSANDAPERDPASYEVWGSNDGGVTFTLISSGSVPAFSARGQEQVINFPRAAALQYFQYKLDFPTVRDPVAANSMQIAEVKLLGAAFPENAFATDNAVAINGDGKGFHLDLPASTQLRRVHLYVGVDNGQGNLTLTMSDGSVLPPTNATLIDDNPSGPKLVMYEIDYKSGLDNQTLGVDWTASNGGTVILSAASWIEFVAPAAPSSVNAVATSKGKININWGDNSNNEQGFKIERANPALGNFTTVGVTGPNVTQFLDSGLSDNTTYVYRVSAFNAAATVPASSFAFGQTNAFAQNGLRAQFWNDEGTNTHTTQNGSPPVVTRIDSNINVNWGTGSPAPGVNVDNFSSQWDGMYIADYTGPTTFFTDTDDGGRLFIDLNQDGQFEWDPASAGTTLPNGELVVNSWVDQGLGIDGVNNGRGIVVNLIAGHAYQIQFQQFEHGGGAGAFLYVQTPFGAQNIVDTTNLIPPVP